MFQSHEFWCQRYFQVFSKDEVGGKIIQGVELESESENLLHLENNNPVQNYNPVQKMVY